MYVGLFLNLVMSSYPRLIAQGQPHVSLYGIIFKTFLYINYSMPPIEASAPRRRMPVIDPEKRARIFQRMHEIRADIIEKYHKDVIIFDLAREIASGDRTDILRILRNDIFVKNELYNDDGRLSKHSTLLLKHLRELYVDGISQIRKAGFAEIDKYTKKRRELEDYLETIKDSCPHTYKLVNAALNVLREVMTGKTRTHAYASNVAWIGEQIEEEQKPAKIVLALSGGAAKGVFYVGFLRALQEAEIWPDFVVGTSAGALAAAALATGNGYEKITEAFSRNKLKKIFGFLSVPFTFISTLGGAVIGKNFGKHLKKVLGNIRFSDIADVFVIASVQQPVSFGKTVIGRASELNRGLELSSNLEVWKAVWGSCAMQGIIPHPITGPFRAERLAEGEFDVERYSMSLPYATLDDGGVVENLPLSTAELILREIKEHGLIISVNLADLNPTGKTVSEYLTVRQAIMAEVKKLEDNAKWYKRPIAFFKGFWAYIKEDLKRFYYTRAPLRVYMGYDATLYQSVIHTMSSARGTGLKILLNPNADGSLSDGGVLSFSGTNEIIRRGYQAGKELVDILLRDQSITKID